MNSLAFTSCIFSYYLLNPRDLAYTLQLSHFYLLQSTPTSAVQHPEFIIALNKMLRYKMELELKTSSLVNALLKRAEKRGLTGDRSKISPYTVRRNLRPKSKD